MRWFAGVSLATLAMMMATTLFGTGVAWADALTGKTYAQAVRTISGWNATPTVASSTGTALPRDECIVTSWQKTTTSNSMGNWKPSLIQLNLNCNATVAAPGKPGNSVMTPQGAADKKADQTAQWLSERPQYCIDNPGDCASFCRQNATKCQKYGISA